MMNAQTKYDDLPWDLIVSALQGELSAGEEIKFQQWLAFSLENRQYFVQLQQIWKDELADYMVYREADEMKAWDSLASRMKNSGVLGGVRDKEIGVIKGVFGSTIPLIKRIMAVAAVFILILGGGWWYLSGRFSQSLYQTSLNEQKKISLPDGSTVLLKSQSSLQIEGSFNKASRTLVLANGEAYFEVIHQEKLPFIVEMDDARIMDMGTSFTVKKTIDSIKVIVYSGKVSFIKKETGETREIAAGSSLCFNIKGHNFEKIRLMSPDVSNSYLKFENTPLSEVIAVLEKVSGNKIVLNDTGISQKRLTAHLGSETFENSLNVICSSLNLEYSKKNGTYILTKKVNSLH